jgi:hypothetical protein
VLEDHLARVSGFDCGHFGVPEAECRARPRRSAPHRSSAVTAGRRDLRWSLQPANNNWIGAIAVRQAYRRAVPARIMGPVSHVTAFLLLVLCQATASAQPAVQPYAGVTIATRVETEPRPVRLHVAEVDLSIPGVRVGLTGPSGPLEVVRRTTADHVRSASAQVGVNGHFFLPFPSDRLEADLVGIAASEGVVYSAFESPAQSYALVNDAPGINIDRRNLATIVRRAPGSAAGTQAIGAVELWTTVSGSAQIVTDGVVTIPLYRDAANPAATLTPGGGASRYSNERSWYDVANARTAIGISRDGRRLTLVVVDARGGSAGLTVRELAALLVRDYDVWQALNLDGGGSATMVVADPITNEPRVLSVSADGPTGRAVGSSLLVFAPRRSSP